MPNTSEGRSPAFRVFLAWLLTVCVVSWAGVHALSYMRVVNSEHAYKQASHWMYSNIARGSKILNVHWDDGLPLFLPEGNPQLFQYQTGGPRWDLQVYEADNEAKLAGMVEKLAAADYLVFPTQRIPGSIPRLPKEYPHTTAMLQLLFAEKLGYQLQSSFKTQPGFLGLTFNDDLADESFSVYDHPKVNIFKNVENLPKDEIKARILDPKRFEPLPGREEILLREAGAPAILPAAGPSAWQALIWMVVLELLSLLTLPLISLFLGGRSDLAYPFAKSLGLFIFGYSVWLLHSLKVIDPGPGGCWFVVLVFGLGFFVLCGRVRWSGYFQAAPALLFWGSFGLFLLIRATNPEIFWGEKPMNFTFLNYFLRLAELPPDDPWAAGQKMHYYYLGSYFFAFLHKLSGVDPRIGYNLSIATIAAFLITSAYGVLRLWGVRNWLAVAGGLGLAVLSNLEWVRLFFFEHRPLTFDLYWATTRLFTAPSFAEYPIWSYVFGDLHAHVIALPFLVSAIGIAGWSMLGAEDRVSGRKRLFSWLLIGVLWGALFALNSWDFISLSLVLGCFGLGVVSSGIAEHCWSWRRWLMTAALAVLALVLALLCISPFLLGSGGGVRVHFGWNQPQEFNALPQILRHVGVWVGLIGVTFLAGLRPLSRGAWLRFLQPVLYALVPFLLAAGSGLASFRELPWGIVSLCMLGAFAGAYSALAEHGDKTNRISGMAVVAAFWLIAFAEVVFIMDRMNTIFKLYNALWVLLGLGAAGSIEVFLRRLPQMRFRRTAQASLVVVGGGLIAAALLGGLLNVVIMASFQRVEGPRPSLDGDAYLSEVAPQEAELMRWINTNIRGTPVMLEAHGNSYGPYTRVAMHTGLPTVLGWEYHVVQRGTPWFEVQQRMRDVKEIYQTLNVRKSLELLAKYKVQYVVFGELEAYTYGEAAVLKFVNDPKTFEPVFAAGREHLFRVRQNANG
jgi:YYY domain-containing protein